MKQIYIVEGRAGEYDTAREWPVCAYEDEAMAKDHADRANTRSQELSAEYLRIQKNVNPIHRYDEILALKNEHDPDFYPASEPTDYIYYPIPFVAK